MKTIEEQIKELKSKLTGNLLEDGEIQMEIYELKKQLNPSIEKEPDQDDEGCLYCGS
jgi:regulator of replication initiation timing